MTVTNAGPSAATGFSITDVVPPTITGVTVLCARHGHRRCGIDGSTGNSISFTNASLAAGAGHALTLTVTGTIAPDAIGALVNTATVAPGAGSIDTNPANNSATDTDTRDLAQVDLAITKTDGQTTYVPGTAITYTIVVTNAGPSTATGFSITDAVPGGDHRRHRDLCRHRWRSLRHQRLAARERGLQQRQPASGRRQRADADRARHDRPEHERRDRQHRDRHRRAPAPST